LTPCSALHADICDNDKIYVILECLMSLLSRQLKLVYAAQGIVSQNSSHYAKENKVQQEIVASALQITSPHKHLTY